MSETTQTRPISPWGVAEPEPPRPVAFGISPLFLALVAAFLASGVALATVPSPHGALTFVFVVLGWLVSLVAHEFGHAFTAWRGGDYTVPGRGYLTLDPRRYMDNLTSVAIPLVAVALGGIALPGGAVMLRMDLIRSRAWRTAASLAGPGMTLLFMLLLGLTLFGMKLAGLGEGPLAAALAFLTFIQATALILNLLPIPGLDGYGALSPWLPERIQLALRPIEPWAIMGLFALVLLVRPIGQGFMIGAMVVAHSMGVGLEQFTAGFEAFRFWRTTAS